MRLFSLLCAWIGVEAIDLMFFRSLNREVAASPALLNMPDRVDWKACKVSKDEETRMAAVFRKKFQPYDFNLE